MALPSTRIALSCAVLILAAQHEVYAANPPESSPAPTKLTRMNCGARIECITPDGQTGHVSKLPEPGATALIMEDDTVTCLLQEGRTDFVVELPKTPLLDRLTFLNESSLARGELKIAVSDQRLKADSAGWVEVDGIIPFSHKRLFGVSLVGIEARFIRLSFRVEKAGRIAAVAHVENKATDATSNTAEAFSVSALENALESKFTGKANASSVGPLTASTR